MKHKCQNCDWTGDEASPIDDIFQRVEPGEPMPSGQCPECHALCHDADATSAVGDLSAVLRQIIKDTDDYFDSANTYTAIGLFEERMRANCEDAERAIAKANGGAS